MKDFFDNPRYRGLLLGHGWNKGTGMGPEEKIKHRKEALERYNNKPESKIRIKRWHEEHKSRVREIKKKYSDSSVGRIKSRENSHRRIERERELKKTLNLNYFMWLCKKLDFTCLGCGKKCNEKSITIDHQLPINRGGDNDEWNIIPLCKSCNSRKQDRLMFVDSVIADIFYGEWLIENIH
jgi:5-methylcytosine-specific restriction enzyme A